MVYPLDEVLLATLAGAETFTGIARFGEKKLVLSRRFRPFADGCHRTTGLARSSQRPMPNWTCPGFVEI